MGAYSSQMAMPLTTALKETKIQLEAGNVLSKNPVIYAGLSLQTAQPVGVVMDSMAVTLNAPKLNAFVGYNTKDTTVIPEVQASVDCQAINGYFKDIKADLQPTQLEASLVTRASLCSYSRRILRLSKLRYGTGQILTMKKI